MVTIWFETHATSIDNEDKIASGWFDVQLSMLGKQQAKELGVRYKTRPIDAVFCSDLGRSLQTAAIAYGGDPLYADPSIIFVDWRLRECDYGDFTQKSSELVEAEKPNRITKRFPGGESYQDCAKRMKSFIDDLKNNFDGKTVLIVGHAATRYCLEHFVNGLDFKTIIIKKFIWQPGWKYELK